VLQYLAARPGQLISKEQILSVVWPDVHVEEHVLKVAIAEIRKALDDTRSQPQYIETAYGRGYRFIGKLRSAPEPAVPAGAVPSWMPVTHYTRSGDVNIAYQVLGEGPIDLVFIMGWVSHLEYFWTEPSFARFLRRLSSFCRVILFDKRGTGLSDRVPVSQLPTLEQRVSDLQAVMDAVGSRKAVLCGVSEGASMAAFFAARCPERSAALVMIGSYAKRIRDATYPWGPTESEREHFLDEIREHWGGPVGLEERAPSVASDPDFRRWWATYLRMSASPGAAVALTRMNAQADIRGLLPEIRVPALVVHRSGDRCLQVEEGRYVASLLPGARFLELPGIDHLPFVGDQDAILDEVERFLENAGVTRSRSAGADAILCASFRVPRGDTSLQASLRKRLRHQAQREIERIGSIKSRWEHTRVYAAFHSPVDAIRCGWALTACAAEWDAEARVGVDLGELEGEAAQRARDVEAQAQPGETLVSAEVRAAAARSGIRFGAKGSVCVAEPGPIDVSRARQAASA
jgi:pimeloyl-ACP methyl ester carboxylesterase